MKPAAEFWVLARKPLSESSVAANVTRWGTGALNIAACRLERAAGDVPGWHETGADGTNGFNGSGTFRTRKQSAEEIQARCAAGRWPPNVLLDEEAARLVDEQSGVLTSGANPTRRGTDKFRGIYAPFAGQPECVPARGADSGGASRFFYVAKASRSERDKGCESLPDGTRNRVNPGGLEYDPKWAPVQAKNVHPTVKPLALLRWLVRLITPPEGDVLDPFMGSGSMGVACELELFGYVGIEREPPYFAIAQARLAADRNLFALDPP